MKRRCPVANTRSARISWWIRYARASDAGRRGAFHDAVRVRHRAPQLGLDASDATAVRGLTGSLGLASHGSPRAGAANLFGLVQWLYLNGSSLTTWHVPQAAV